MIFVACDASTGCMRKQAWTGWWVFGWLLAIGLVVASFAGTVRAQTPAPTVPTQPSTSTPAAGPAPPAADAKPPETKPPETKPDLPPAVTLPPEMTVPVERLSKSLKSAETAIEHFNELEDELGHLRTSVESILSEAQETAESLRPKLADVKSQIERLGPVPAAGQPPESAEIVAERAKLQSRSALLDGAIKSTELTWVRARQLIEKITVMRHALFTRNLLERLPSPLLPALWHDVVSDSPAVGRRLRYLSTDWWGWAQKSKPELIALVLAAMALFGALVLATGRLIAWGMRGIDAKGLAYGAPTGPSFAAGAPGTASFFERAAAVAWIAPLHILPGAVAALTLFGGLEVLELLFAPWDRLGTALLKAVLAFVAVAALIDAALTPKHPGWRLVPLSDRSARRINRILLAMVLIYTIDYALTEMSRVFFIPLALSVVQSFSLSMGFALLLMGLAWTPFEWARTRPLPAGAAEAHAPAALLQPSVGRLDPHWLKGPMWALAIGIIAASMLGYVALGRFASNQLVLTGIVFSVAGLCYLAIRALTRPRADGRYSISDTLETRFSIDAPRQRQLARLAELVLTSALLLLALPALLLQWGFASADIADWYKKAVFGFDIGHFHISLARILIGTGLFVALLFLTRVMQQWLREGLLAPARMDQGIANSIDQAFGYAGITLAALLAVSYAGFDVTSLAIVAGALSVGIGFGLQSIVNNFVSGLILLVERPIKVGDWVVLGDLQGNVRRISVRSTEIETFEKASLIVPNSELISGRVVNWTHRNLLGRMVLKFTLDGNADPEVVLKIMTVCAAAHPQVMATPPPRASLDQFTPGALDFSLRATVNDVTRGQGVQTDLRVAILKELRKAGQITAVAPLPVVPGTLPTFGVVPKTG